MEPANNFCGGRGVALSALVARMKPLCWSIGPVEQHAQWGMYRLLQMDGSAPIIAQGSGRRAWGDKLVTAERADVSDNILDLFVFQRCSPGWHQRRLTDGGSAVLDDIEHVSI